MLYYKKMIIELGNKFAAKLDERYLFRGEFTDDLRGYFESIHENLLILYRILSSSSDLKETQEIITKQIISIIKLLKPDRFLRFDFNREYDVIGDAIGRMQHIKHQIEKSNLSNADQVVNDIIHDLEQASSLFMAQNETLDREIMVNPTRMTERVNQPPDHFSHEDVSMDFPGFDQE